MLNKKKSLAALFVAMLLCTTFSQETSALSKQAQTPAVQTTNASAIQLTPAQQLEQWRSPVSTGTVRNHGTAVDEDICRISCSLLSGL